MKIGIRNLLSLILSSFIVTSAHAAEPPVFMENMTWMEIRDHIHDGDTTVIVPTGGTEQNGPQMITGKHNIIVRYTAGEIAKKLGHTLVAPVMPYVPEGRISPPEGHMQFAGTLSLSDATFGAMLEDTARSLKQHGFKLICFVGDHSGSQSIQQQVANKLSSLWEDDGVRVLQVSDYYFNNGQEKWNGQMGIVASDADAHAGLVDTSELMALDPHGVRDNLRGVRSERDYNASGAMGDSSQSSAKYGKHYLNLKINAAVKQIRYAAETQN